MNFTRVNLALSVVFGLAYGVFAQGADVSLPQQRDGLVAAAKKLVEFRSAPPAIPNPAPNPFVWPVDPTQVVATPGVPATPVPEVVGPQLLAKLASRMPVTGSFMFNGEGILLLGQKKLKAGDSVTISFEGKNYNLIVASIVPPTFTVRLGDLLHTRPVSYSISTATPRP
jgi:hypothetical protein